VFNLGAPEVLVIAVLALLVLGPQRLPDAARQIGSFMGEIRKLSSGFQRELKTAFDEETETAARARGAAVTNPATVDDPEAAPPMIGSMQPVDADLPTLADQGAEAADADAAGRTNGRDPVVVTTPTQRAAARKAAATKAAPAKRATPAKKAAPAKRPAAAKKAAPAKPTKRAAPVAKAAPAKRAAPAKKAAPAKRAADKAAG
jgi:Tat protein translocase TatB subunit